jgi:ElaB/YqjD/DUF883 family membrane-anchored ribosome-binding protein
MAIISRTRAQDSASSITDSALDKMRDVRSGMQDIASRSMDVMGDTASAAQQRLGRYAGATTRYVSEEPIKAALIAAAVGAVVAAAVLLMRSRRDRYYY